MARQYSSLFRNPTYAEDLFLKVGRSVVIYGARKPVTEVIPQVLYRIIVSRVNRLLGGKQEECQSWVIHVLYMFTAKLRQTPLNANLEKLNSSALLPSTKG